MIPNSIPGFTDPFSSLTHLAAAFMALIGSFFLVRRARGNGTRIFSLVVFSLTLVFLFSMSGVFHLLDRGGTARLVLQRLDHAGIWALIAGTFTPIHMILFRGIWRWMVLLIIWTFAITGLVLEVVFFDSFPQWLIVTLFLSLGWVGGISMYHFSKTFGDRSVRMVAAGGIFYSIGAIIDLINWPILLDGIIGPHEIFHVFVVLGAASHWLFIYRWSHHPTVNHVTVNVHILSPTKWVGKILGETTVIEAQSLEELKRLLKISVREKFHSTIEPKVHLRYFEEEYL